MKSLISCFYACFFCLSALGMQEQTRPFLSIALNMLETIPPDETAVRQHFIEILNNCFRDPEQEWASLHMWLKETMPPLPLKCWQQDVVNIFQGRTARCE